jgi:adenine phosphoribosyltransferase
MRDLKNHIRGIPDFPKPGILFYDIGTLLAHGPAWQETVARLAEIIRPLNPDALIGIEARGFLVASAVAAHLGCGFVMARKKGKLPGKTVAYSYQLEYGADTIEMQKGILPPGSRVVICDDLLATGGTAAAVIALAQRMEIDVVHAAFIIELSFLKGREKLGIPATSLIGYDN